MAKFEKGKVKTGGRVKGTPNKDNPLKVLLHQHSIDYFSPSIPAGDKMMSQFDIDCEKMKPVERAKIESEILKYHTPQMQSVSADVDVKSQNMSFVERLTRLANGEDLDSDTDA